MSHLNTFVIGAFIVFVIVSYFVIRASNL
jgi:hypothetical protein